MPVQRRFSFEVSGEPEQVAERLREQTRWRLTPWQGSPFGNPVRRPLGGRVGGARFSVGLDDRDWWTLYQAAATGRLVPTETGTRVEGVAGLPGWIAWVLRFAFVLGLTIGGVGAVAPLLGGEPGALMIAPLLFGFVLTTLTLAIGWNVRNADEQVPRLLETVQQAASRAPVAAGTTAEAPRQRQRATARELER